MFLPNGSWPFWSSTRGVAKPSPRSINLTFHERTQLNSLENFSGGLAEGWLVSGTDLEPAGPEQAAAAIPVAAPASKRRTDVGSAYGSARAAGILDSPGRRDRTLRHGRTIVTDPVQALSPGVCDSGCTSEERGKINSMLSDHVMWVRMGASMPLWEDVRIQTSFTKYR
jgi:hypothetical protein